MQYRTLSSGTIAENLSGLLDGSTEDLTSRSELYGTGTLLNCTGLDTAISEIRAALDDHRDEKAWSDIDEDQFEGAMAIRLYEALADYPLDVLDDPSFWAYLAAGPLWFFVKWREDPSERKTHGYLDYLDGRVNHACVPLRMFLRVQAVADAYDPSLAAAVPKGTDFWRSHIIRVKTGAMPDLARAVTKQQRDARMTVGPLREYAKRINRRWSNQAIYLLDATECDALAQSERD